MTKDNKTSEQREAEIGERQSGVVYTEMLLYNMIPNQGA